ncbi:MAG: hypothetical protein OXI44_01390 [Bacteroidota bacterium]|nr:hypothetical protein [Bacteroidota bacterium]
MVLINVWRFFIEFTLFVVTDAPIQLSGYAYTRNGKLNDGTENSCTMPCLFTYPSSYSGLFKAILFSRWPDMC